MEESLNSTKRFSDRVENYVKYRPDYPAIAFSFIKDQFALSKSSIVVDVGSGTGISTGPFLDLGCVVNAVEPNSEMRKAAENAFAGRQTFHSIDGTAENTKLPSSSADLVIAAQAFHWFDPSKFRSEVKRILKPNGHAVLMWNIRKETGTRFLESYEKVLCAYGTDYMKVRRQNVTENGSLDTFFGKDNYQVKTFRHSKRFDLLALKGLLLSSSYAPNEGHVNYAPMIEKLTEIFNTYADNGEAEMPYETMLYFGRI